MVHQVAQLRRGAPQIVPSRAPPLILAAVDQLVRQDRQIVRRTIGQEDPIAQRHRPPAAQSQDGSAEPSPAPLHPDAVPVHQ